MARRESQRRFIRDAMPPAPSAEQMKARRAAIDELLGGGARAQGGDPKGTGDTPRPN
jgi:hypothetical protein